MSKITLKRARELSGYTKEEASSYLGISIDAYIFYEKEPGSIPKNIACKIKKLYNVSLDLIEIK